MSARRLALRLVAAARSAAPVPVSSRTLDAPRVLSTLTRIDHHRASATSTGGSALGRNRIRVELGVRWMSTGDPPGAGPSGPASGPAPAPPIPTSLPPVVELTDEKELNGMVRWASAEGVAMLFDFYADWCQPCKQLTPKLEKLATESNGKCVLVKVDVDAHSGISDQLRIQSLPTVHAMVDGKFIDTFSGVLPDDELAAFVDRAVNVAAVGASQTQRTAGDDSESGETRPGGGGGGMDVETVVDAAFKALDSGDVETAAAAFGAALATDPPPAPGVRARAYAGAARCALRASPPDVDAAKQLVDAARKTVDGKFTEPVEIAAAAAAAELHGAAADLGLDMSASGDALDDTLASLRADIDAMTKAGDKEGADDKREELSLRVLLQRGDAGAAVEVALESVKKGTRERGRAMCVRMFDALGATHPVTVSGRKRLSNLWFL